MHRQARSAATACSPKPETPRRCASGGPFAIVCVREQMRSMRGQALGRPVEDPLSGTRESMRRPYRVVGVGGNSEPGHCLAPCAMSSACASSSHRDRGDLRRDGEVLEGRARPRRQGRRQVLNRGNGLPVGAQPSALRGHRGLPRTVITPAGGRMTASTSPGCASVSSAPALPRSSRFQPSRGRPPPLRSSSARRHIRCPPGTRSRRRSTGSRSRRSIRRYARKRAPGRPESSSPLQHEARLRVGDGASRPLHRGLARHLPNVLRRIGQGRALLTPHSAWAGWPRRSR